MAIFRRAPTIGIPLAATLDNKFGIMEQPQVKIIGGREYAATGSKFGPSYLPVDVMARMNNSAHQGLAMSAIVHVLIPSSRVFDNMGITNMALKRTKDL